MKRSRSTRAYSFTEILQNLNERYNPNNFFVKRGLFYNSETTLRRRRDKSNAFAFIMSSGKRGNLFVVVRPPKQTKCTNESQPPVPKAGGFFMCFKMSQRHWAGAFFLSLRPLE